MGVIGLMTFILNDNKSLKSHKLRKTKVILDGNNLLHSIHHAHKVPWEFGGEYDSFAKSIIKFFDRLKLCEIEPFVVFDGCYDAQGSKLKTTISRFKDRIFTCTRLNKKYPCEGYLIPMLSPQTMISILRKLNIEFITCHEEADREAAALANHWNCPVISNDSDFFIFPLTRGFIPVGNLNFIPVEEACSCCDSGSHHFMSCSIFHHSNFFLNRAENLAVNGQLMPLFATLMGNDFVPPSMFYKIFDQINTKRSGKNMSPNGVKIISLLNWLHQFSSLEIALNKIVMSLKQDERDYFESRISMSMRQYELVGSRLVASVEGRDSEPSVFHNLPSHINHLLSTYSLSPVLANSILSGNVFLHTYVEVIESPPVHSLTSDLRDLFYCALSRMASTTDKTVNEYQRKGRSVYKRRVVMRNMVDTDCSSMISDLQSSVTDQLSFIRTMVLHCINLRGSANWTTSSTLALLVGVISQYAWTEQLQQADSSFHKERYQSALHKFHRDPIISNTHKLQLKVVHLMNELQAVYFSLTQLLCLGDNFLVDSVPGPEWLFGGKLFYNLYLDLIKRKNCRDYVFLLFDEFPLSRYRDFFDDVVADICEVMPHFK